MGSYLVVAHLAGPPKGKFSNVHVSSAPSLGQRFFQDLCCAYGSRPDTLANRHLGRNRSETLASRWCRWKLRGRYPWACRARALTSSLISWLTSCPIFASVTLPFFTGVLSSVGRRGWAPAVPRGSSIAKG